MTARRELRPITPLIRSKTKAVIFLNLSVFSSDKYNLAKG